MHIFETSGFVLKQFWLGLTYSVTICTQHQAIEENFEKFTLCIWGLFVECYNYPCQQVQVPRGVSSCIHQKGLT